MHESSRNFKIFFASGGAAQAGGAMITQNPEPPLAGPDRDQREPVGLDTGAPAATQRLPVDRVHREVCEDLLPLIAKRCATEQGDYAQNLNIYMI